MFVGFIWSAAIPFLLNLLTGDSEGMSAKTEPQQQIPHDISGLK